MFELPIIKPSAMAFWQFDLKLSKKIKEKELMITVQLLVFAFDFLA